jgi:ribosome-associated toxin RatA of RatAB toxin-antitoxin module
MLPPLRCRPSGMHQTNSTIINAPADSVFEAAADLERWPTFLPHYRYIRYFEKGRARNIVKMAAKRGVIPVSWVSEQIIDREKREVCFTHLKAWTKGMKVVWRFKAVPAGIEVEIIHDLAFRSRLLVPIAEPIIGRFFVGYIANQTLKHMKTHLEKK